MDPDSIIYIFIAALLFLFMFLLFPHSLFLFLGVALVVGLLASLLEGDTALKLAPVGVLALILLFFNARLAPVVAVFPLALLLRWALDRGE
ncbi:MAG: hypothetical protein NZ954_08495 [Thermofilaceae archaeon]|nr:hypothetical protein [Thermofilaceae archaeon]MDW8005030.1 hypothetical protein [Thermofilaceae archaeon]